MQAIRKERILKLHLWFKSFGGFCKNGQICWFPKTKISFFGSQPLCRCMVVKLAGGGSVAVAVDVAVVVRIFQEICSCVSYILQRCGAAILQCSSAYVLPSKNKQHSI